MGVGQLIDKLFGGAAAQNEAVLRAYGKLPFYAEYRRLEVSPGVPTAFSQWLDEGRLAWVRSSMKSEKGVTRPSRLLLMLPGAKEAVVANVWDSRDNLGRVFPFSFFVACPPDALGDDPLERWVSASAIHREFDRLYSLLHTLAAGGDFYKRFQKHAVALKPDDLAERVKALWDDAASIDVASWFVGLDLDDEIDAARWFAGLLQRAARWEKQSDRTREAALSCPLSNAVPISAQAVVWIDWLVRLAHGAGKAPSIIMPVDDQKFPLDLIFLLRDLIPDDYQLLTSDGRAYGYVEQLSSIPEANGANATLDKEPSGSFAAWMKSHAS